MKTFSTGNIGDILGFKMSAAFIEETLGVSAHERIKKGCYWTLDQLTEIGSALSNHIEQSIDKARLDDDDEL